MGQGARFGIPTQEAVDVEHNSNLGELVRALPELDPAPLRPSVQRRQHSRQYPGSDRNSSHLLAFSSPRGQVPHICKSKLLTNNLRVLQRFGRGDLGDIGYHFFVDLRKVNPSALLHLEEVHPRTAYGECFSDRSHVHIPEIHLDPAPSAVSSGLRSARVHVLSEKLPI